MAHAQGWAVHAAQLESVAAVSTASAAATYGPAWSGAGSAAAAGAHLGLDVDAVGLAAVALAKVEPVLSAAHSYAATVPMMVTAGQAVANRLEEAADEQINPWVWRALTPRIVDLNLEYFGYMWPNNAGRGAAYGLALRAAVAAMANPSVPTVSGASPAAAAAAAVAEGSLM